eukprot:GABV01000307.1.p2 GENE.GABV01000307.1~~GABV01000307.1.p2  ORF type:complete len:466 (+),score=188.62 GABV01000307.1:76-1473(+)
MSAAMGGGWGVPLPASVVQVVEEEDDDKDLHDALVPWNKDPDRVWCLLHKRFVNEGGEDKAEEYARRPLILVGPDEGIVLFDTTASRSMLNYCIMALRCPINPDNVIWLKYRPDLQSCLEEALDRISQRKRGTKVVLRFPDKNLRKMVEEKHLSLDNDIDLPNKEWLHSQDRGLKHTVMLRDPKTGKPVKMYKPFGVTAFGKDALLQGYDDMKKKLGPAGRIVAKITNLTAGTGVYLDVAKDFVATLEPSKKNPIVLEEMLFADRLPGMPEFENVPSVHYVGRQPYGDVCSQLMTGKFFNGVASPAIGMTEDLRAHIHAMCRGLARQFNFVSTWGIDVMVCDGKPYLIDLNFGRLNNTHFAKMFLDLHDLLHLPFRSFKRDIPEFPNGLTSVWAMLIAQNLAFTSEGRRGVAVLAFDNGHRASFVATAKTAEEVRELQVAVDELLNHAFDDLGQARPGEREPDQQ